MPIRKETLQNGVRVLVEPVSHVGSASIGLWCTTGSIHETGREAGITHFIEHMLFKGTERRTAKEIAEAIEGRGGMLNAFTDREQTCYYCRVMAADAVEAIDVLCDMATAAKLDQEEIEREKNVVIEEIKRTEDEPGDHVHDLHLQGLFPDHPLGRPVIGTRDSVASFGQDDLRAYIARRYLGGNVLLSAAGNVDPEEIVREADRRLGALPAGGGAVGFGRPAPMPGEELIEDDVEQVHFCIGGLGVSVHDEDLHAAVVLDGIVGGGMSSRLFQEVREKRGLAYSVGSYLATYSPGGAFTVYGGTSLETWPTLREVVGSELDDLARNGPNEGELNRVKRNVSGSLALSLEGMSARMMRLARNEIHFGRDVPLEETLSKIGDVTAEAVHRLANRLFAPESLRTTAIGPFARGD
jgi:predicted Zn-dependent peptidase